MKIGAVLGVGVLAGLGYLLLRNNGGGGLGSVLSGLAGLGGAKKSGFSQTVKFGGQDIVIENAFDPSTLPPMVVAQGGTPQTGYETIGYLPVSPGQQPGSQGAYYGYTSPGGGASLVTVDGKGIVGAQFW